LFKPYSLLLADEPSAHLDNDSKEMLLSKMKEVSSFVLVTHDRDMLEMLCNKINEVSNGNIHEYNGSYKDYLQQKTIEKDRSWNEYFNYTEQKKKLQNSYTKKKS
jgi:macrolide transport system ATP-binding/permease protein